MRNYLSFIIIYIADSSRGIAINYIDTRRDIKVPHIAICVVEAIPDAKAIRDIIRQVARISLVYWFSLTRPGGLWEVVIQYRGLRASVVTGGGRGRHGRMGGNENPHHRVPLGMCGLDKVSIILIINTHMGESTNTPRLSFDDTAC